MNAYIDRTAPLFLVSEPGFEAYPVVVPQEVIEVITAINQMHAAVEAVFENGGAPEDISQTAADILTEKIMGVLND